MLAICFRSKFQSKIYPTHRLAWLMAYGVWPSGDIDHINGDRQDNRLCNLRDVSHSRNLFNRQAPSVGNKARLLGVWVSSPRIS